MVQGETRGPIQTDFGFHVIRLEGIQGGALLGTEPAREAAALSDKVLGQRCISDPIALGDDRFVVVQVRTYTKAAAPPLASAHEKVVAALQFERAT